MGKQTAVKANNDNRKYFIVTAMCGHVGNNRCVVIDFPTRATSAAEAADKARNFRRVKRHRTDAIIDVRKVDKREFSLEVKKHANDPYLHSNSESGFELYKQLKDEGRIVVLSNRKKTWDDRGRKIRHYKKYLQTSRRDYRSNGNGHQQRYGLKQYLKAEYDDMV
jgi:hypothetical protein